MGIRAVVCPPSCGCCRAAPVLSEMDIREVLLGACPPPPPSCIDMRDCLSCPPGFMLMDMRAVLLTGGAPCCPPPFGFIEIDMRAVLPPGDMPGRPPARCCADGPAKRLLVRRAVACAACMAACCPLAVCGAPDVSPPPCCRFARLGTGATLCRWVVAGLPPLAVMGAASGPCLTVFCRARSGGTAGPLACCCVLARAAAALIAFTPCRVCT
jgi:hypothetical protein